jgi:hypothetical protein
LDKSGFPQKLEGLAKIAEKHKDAQLLDLVTSKFMAEQVSEVKADILETLINLFLYVVEQIDL